MSWHSAYAAQLRGEVVAGGDGIATMHWFNSDASCPPPDERTQSDADQRSAECYRGVLGSLLLLDKERAAGFSKGLEGTRAEDMALRIHLATLLRALFVGPPLSSTAALLDEVRALARETRQPDLRIHAGIVGALTALREGDVAVGLSLARRASRMARAESLPHEEFFASLTLARARRYDGTHHLALRILSALDRVCMPVWRGWLDWEMAMVGAQCTGEAPGGLPQAAQALRRALGEPQPLRMSNSMFGAEASSALAATSPHVSLTPDVAAWSLGETHTLPAGLSGITAAEEDTTWVFAGPGASARRFLALRSPPTFGRSLQAGKVGRVHEALCILCLAGASGLKKEEFFKSAYGFDYVASLHKATFKVLRHRMRQQLEPVGTLNVEGTRLAIALQEACVIPDPRSGHSLADRVLRVLSRQKTGSAKSASAALNVPLRSVQATLKELVESGDCVPTRDGRNQNYRVEDTTFSDPSLRIRRELLSP